LNIVVLVNRLPVVSVVSDADTKESVVCLPESGFWGIFHSDDRCVKMHQAEIHYGVFVFSSFVWHHHFFYSPVVPTNRVSLLVVSGHGI
jgi:hypothetical protein